MIGCRRFTFHVCRLRLNNVGLQLAVFCHGMVVNGNLYLVGKIFHGVENLANHLYRLVAEICEKRYGCHYENGNEAGCAYHILYSLHAQQAVHAAMVIYLIAHQWGDELGEKR